MDSHQRRAQRLQFTVRAASYWLIAQGLLYLPLNGWLADHLHLRYLPVMVPYIRTAGLAMLCLGLFVVKGVRSARYQYLAVDALILYFLGQVFFTFNRALDRDVVNGVEWFTAVANLACGGCLTAFRTPSSEMAGADNLLSVNTKALLKTLREHGLRPTLGGLEPAVEERPAPETPPAGPKKPGKASEAVPHLD